MTWVLFSLLSAFLLGIYDIFKKESLKENAVIPVLFFSSISGATLFFLIWLVSRFPNAQQWWTFVFIPMEPWSAHLYFLGKSVMVGSSWLLAYFAFKNLPITIVTPIRSSAPVWTLLGAYLIFGELLNPLQWLGVSVTVVFYYLLSFQGKKENIIFRKNKWVFYMIASTMIGACCSLYDKFLVQHYSRLSVQAYPAMYMILVYFPLLWFAWKPNKHKTTPFTWRKSILLIGLTLALADFAYFYAISCDGAMISIISVMRRGSVIIAFASGYFLYNEKNIKNKALILAGIILGLLIIMWGSN